MNAFSFGMLALIGFVFLVFFTIIFLASRYKRCPSDKILVIFGKVAKGRSSRTLHGGGTFVWPLIQDYAYMDLTPITINIPLENALSQQNIRIHVPSTFTVGISTSPDIMSNAAERILHLPQQAIEDMAKEIIFGQLRLTVASLTIEQINQDRESFLEAIRHNVEPELNKIGLHLINVNITDITDESDYIESIGKKAASEAINQARVDVAMQNKYGAIGEADAMREQEIQVKVALTEAEIGRKKAESNQRRQVQEQEALAVEGENTANANIANYNADLEVERASALQRSEVARYDAQVAIQKALYEAELERLRAEEVVREEIKKRKVEIAADAEAERIRREAKGVADSILLKYTAEADGIKKLLASKADGYQKLVDSVDGDSQAAATLLMIEKIEELVSRQVEAISNLKIDKITVWDSGNGDSSSTANFISNLFKSLPPLQDISQMAGFELPEYLGKMQKGKMAEERDSATPGNTSLMVVEDESGDTPDTEDEN
jgi:flotillin